MRKQVAKALMLIALALGAGFAGLAILEMRYAEIDRIYGPQ